ncbi:hypothetical protein ABZ215_34215 [Amycolatopsis sp. NPDC006131]|uniref:hypothetical protein n=1 Tax=Amycolatopsis sp. NPDC006131 TaxID=3156731 RepID=UPI0033AD4102
MIADDLGACHAERSRAARRLARVLPPGHSTVLGTIWHIDAAPTVTSLTRALVLGQPSAREKP